MANKLANGLDIQPLPYYDMDLDDYAFKHMIITASSKMSAGSRVILNTLLEKYNPDAKIVDSSLTELI